MEKNTNTTNTTNMAAENTNTAEPTRDAYTRYGLPTYSASADAEEALGKPMFARIWEMDLGKAPISPLSGKEFRDLVTRAALEDKEARAEKAFKARLNGVENAKSEVAEAQFLLEGHIAAFGDNIDEASEKVREERERLERLVLHYQIELNKAQNEREKAARTLHTVRKALGECGYTAQSMVAMQTKDNVLAFRFYLLYLEAICGLHYAIAYDGDIIADAMNTVAAFRKEQSPENRAARRKAIADMFAFYGGSTAAKLNAAETDFIADFCLPSVQVLPAKGKNIQRFALIECKAQTMQSRLARLIVLKMQGVKVTADNVRKAAKAEGK